MSERTRANRARIAKDRLKKIDQLIDLAKEEEHSVADIDNANDSVLDTEKVKNTIKDAKKLSETDDMIRKLSKRLTRHRTEIDELIKAYESIKLKIKEEKPVVIDDKIKSEIVQKLEDKFVSKEELEEMRKLMMGGLA